MSHPHITFATQLHTTPHPGCAIKDTPKDTVDFAALVADTGTETAPHPGCVMENAPEGAVDFAALVAGAGAEAAPRPPGEATLLEDWHEPSAALGGGWGWLREVKAPLLAGFPK